MNYQEIFENEMFLLAVKNTCRYMLVTVPVTLGAAVGLSVVLRHVARGVTFLRLSFLYPMIMPIASIVLARLAPYFCCFLDSVHSVFLAVYRVLCVNLFCKTADDPWRILRVCGPLRSRGMAEVPVHHLAAFDPGSSFYAGSFGNECIPLLQRGIPSGRKLS